MKRLLFINIWFPAKHSEAFKRCIDILQPFDKGNWRGYGLKRPAYNIRLRRKRPGFKAVMLDGLKGQLIKYITRLSWPYQAALYMTPTTQGDPRAPKLLCGGAALGCYKRAFQAGNPKPGLYQIYFYFTKFAILNTPAHEKSAHPAFYNPLLPPGYTSRTKRLY